MNNWLKMGALALALGAFGAMSGAASAEPKPNILTPPTKADPASARAKPGEPIFNKDNAKAGKDGDHGKSGDEHGKPGDTPAGADSAAAGAGSAAAAGAPPDEEKLKEIRAKIKARIDEHKAKVKEHRAEIKKKIEEKLKGQPMVAAMKQELKHHARRISRLERAKDVAEEAGDSETAARVDKLIEKETARHDKWMAGFDAKAAGGAKKDEKAGEK